jgi:pyrimidine-nucleoside phosphorylase
LIPARVIAAKRDGNELTNKEIQFFIGDFTSGDIPDYQMSALAMAVFLNGMTVRETQALTTAMLDSGQCLHWPNDGVLRVDKHSTGGIGDKTSIILAPLLAECGLRIPMLSGRGLGPTGGTLDKLEAIPGLRTDLNYDQIIAVTQTIGCVITGTTPELAPADRKLYALRDVTATVPSIPLITASIMSKKLAESLDALVLDVKFGSGAFMKTQHRAKQLAQSLVDTGAAMGVPTTALLTDMNQPLGRMCGNAVEILECIDVLKGHGPHDLLEVTLELAAELLLSTGVQSDRSAALDQLAAKLSDGSAFDRYRRMIQAQGGDPDATLRIAPATDVLSTGGGYVAAIDTEAIGHLIIAMGGGRKQLGDAIDHSVGVEMLVRIGDRVTSGQPLAKLFHSDSPELAAQFRETLTLSTDAGAELDIVAGRIN